MSKFDVMRASAAAVLSLSCAAAFAQSATDLCTAPGATVLEDAGGDVQPGVLLDSLPAGLPLDFADLLSLQVAQPPQEDGISRLVFTLNVADLEMLPSLPPSNVWFASFSTPGGLYGVRMLTDQMGAPSFQSYMVAPGGAMNDGVSDGRFVVEGSEKPADATSNVTGGAITFVVPAQNVGLRDGTGTVGQFNAAHVVTVTVPMAVTFADTFDKMPDDLGRRGSVELPGDSCPKNAAASKSTAAPAQFAGSLGLALLLPLLIGGLVRRRK